MKEITEEIIQRYLNNSCSKQEVKWVIKYFKEKEKSDCLNKLEISWNNYQESENNIENTSKQLRILHNKLGFNTNKLIILKKVRRYVAILLLPMMLVGTYLLYTNYSKYYIGDISGNFDKTNKGVIILSDGKKIDIEKNKSTITYDSLGDTISINNKKVVNKAVSNKMQYNQIIIPAGERHSIVLSDGSKVWLNSKTKFKFPKSFKKAKVREVFLDGEAYIKVAKNKDKPFILRTKHTNVRALGTEFNVSAYSQDQVIETILVEGSVIVSNRKLFGKSEYILKPGKKASYQKNKNKFTISQVDTQIETSWIKGKLILNNLWLEEVIIKFKRWYGVEIEMDKELVQKYKLTITVKDESIYEELERIKSILPIEFNQKDNKINIYKRLKK